MISEPASDSNLPVSFPTRAVSFLLVFLAVCYLWALGHMPLIDPDEPVYGETGKLMALSHSFAAWWTPHYNGQMWFDKPPLTYWLIGLSMTLFGASDFAARLPMALAALMLVWLTTRLAWRLYPASQSVPLWAALVIGTCLMTPYLAHACVTDMLLAASLAGAILGTWEWLQTARWMPILWAGAAIGIGTLIKGPVAIVLLGAQLLIYLLATRQGKRFLSAQLWLSLLLSLVIALPWYVSMIHLHGQFFVSSFLEAQNITRYTHAEHKGNANPFFFVPVLIAGFLPWTFALFPALFESFKRAKATRAALRASESQNPDLYALIWIALVFVFFSASQSKLITYIYPLYPLAACVTGHWISQLRNGSRASLSGSVIAALLIYISLGLVFGYCLRERWITLAALVIELIVALLALMAPYIILRSSNRGRIDKKAIAAQALSAAAGLMLVMTIPVLASAPYWDHPDPKSFSAPGMAHAVEAHSQPGDTIYALTFNKPSLVYYSNRNIVYTDNQEVVGPNLAKPPYPICVTTPDIIGDLIRKHLLAPYKILARSGNNVVLIQCGQRAQRL